MLNMPTVGWAGISGVEYHYWIYPIGVSLAAGAGNYIYAREIRPGVWIPIYIGETGNLAERRLGAHHRRDCILGCGATHIHVHPNAGYRARLSEETDLRTQWNPPCR